MVPLSHDMTGTGDTVVRQVAIDLTNRPSDTRHVQRPWGGHLPSLERPAETATLLKNFLSASP